MNEPTPIREYEEAVYVFWYGPALPTVKIGHSNAPDKRLAQLGNDTGVPDHLASFAAIVWLDRKREKVEARAHELAAKLRKSGEWFELTAAEAVQIIVVAAKELNIRYEVENRSNLILDASIDNVFNSNSSRMDKGQQNRLTIVEKADEKVVKARLALEAAELRVSNSANQDKKYYQHLVEMAQTELDEAELELQSAESKVANNPTAEMTKFELRKKFQEEYWQEHPYEYRNYQETQKKNSARESYWRGDSFSNGNAIMRKTEMPIEDAKSVDSWNDKFKKREATALDYRLGMCHFSGNDGYPKDTVLAYEYLMSAAKESHAGAQRMVSTYHWKGYPPASKDLVVAYLWCELASDANDFEARNQLNAIAVQITSKQQAEIQIRKNTFRKEIKQ